MSKSSLKGITFEFNGNTVKLNEALSSVDKTIKTTEGNLRELSKYLKLDPGNSTLLNQRFEELKQEIDSTKEKLKTLKDAQKQVEQEFNDGKIDIGQYQAFQREIGETEAKLVSLQDTAKTTGGAVATHFKQAGAKIQSVGQKVSGVGQALMPVTGSVLAIGTAAVTVGDNFEAQMSRVKAISGATGSDFDKLRQQALDLGQSTAYSAGEVAQGMENLASAGFSTKEIMEAMPGMLNLAASSGEDLATSSDIAASTLRGFGLAASDAGHVADVLAQNAAKTNAAVADTGAAMKYIAPVAQNAGWSLEQVTAAIGEMADAGIKGEQAGTTLRGALTNLMNPSSTAADAMSSIGFSAYDSSGKMKSLSTIIQELGAKTKGLTDQQRDQKIATIMGTDALSGMQVLLKDGNGNLNQLTSALKNSNGAAQQMATTMQGNTKGAIEQMTGSLETAAIKIQTVLAPAITKVATFIGQLVDKFSALSTGQQQQIVKIAAIVAAIAPLLVIIGKLITGIGGITKAIGAIMMNPIPALIAGIVTAIAGLVLAVKHLWDTNEGFRNAVITIWNGIKTFFSTLGAFFKGVFDAICTAGQGFINFFKSIPEWWNQLWTGVGQFFQNTWNNISNFFTQWLPNFINNAKKWFDKLPENIGYALGYALGKLTKWGADALAWAGKAIPELINNIGTFFSELPGKIWNFLVQAINKIKEWGSNCISYVKENFPKFVAAVIMFFASLPAKIWNELVKIVTSLGKWISNMISYIQANFPKFIETVLEFFRQIPSKMLEIGKQIVEGLWKGISETTSWLMDKIGEFCNGIVDGIKDALGIHSPSRVMADEVGQWMAKGIGVGFVENMAAVSKQMQAAIPTNFDMNVNYGINDINGINSGFTYGQTLNGGRSAFAPKFEINMGNIIVKGSADKNSINEIKKVAAEQVGQLKREMTESFEGLPTYFMQKKYVRS